MTEQQLPAGAIAVLKAAKKLADEGYQEGLNNDTIMGKWFGLNYQPWCAMFVSWCFKEANLTPLVASQTKKGFASCTVGLKHFTKQKQLVTLGQAQAGDIAFFQFDADADPDHVGIVYKNFPDKGYMLCYEGNTSGDKKGSQSNGDGVYLKKRPYTLVMAIARPKW